MHECIGGGGGELNNENKISVRKSQGMRRLERLKRRRENMSKMDIR
jgi:hypothetical protein